METINEKIAASQRRGKKQFSGKFIVSFLGIRRLELNMSTTKTQVFILPSHANCEYVHSVTFFI
jgi:hypothetical protein